MSNEQMSFVADALLAIAREERDAPFYTDEKLRNLCRKDRDWCQSFAHVQAQDCATFELLLREYRDILRNAKLTRAQDEILALRLQGRTFDEIAACRHRTKQIVQRIFIIALKKLARSHHVYPYSGLSEVYRNEVQRGVRPGFGTLHR